MKALRIYLLLGMSALSLSAVAQNIDLGNPALKFTASGSSENFSSEEAQDFMNSAAAAECSGLGAPRQLTPTSFRTAYGARFASAEFDCLGNSFDEAEYNPLPTNNGPHRPCWYFDDSNPNCFKSTSQNEDNLNHSQ